ncbi:MAG: SDR family oxidoreductase [Bacteroidetes bacterium]|nr:MAG: SDR family oxidoreductase [Bacteroidota bacterium]
MIDLRKQVALVTGGSRGIGAAAAILLAKAGADVALTYQRDEHSAGNIAKAIKKLKRNCLLLQGSIERSDDCKRFAAETKRRFKRIDILVNSAGIWEYGEIGTMNVNDWLRTIDINLTGTFNMCNAVVPIMKKQQYGRIITVSSTAGQRGEAFHSQYAASKGGVIAFTKSIAVELIRSGVWVNCVAPGWVDTDMAAPVFKNVKRKKEIVATIPRGKVASPIEIAGPIVFLASELANHIVGEVINVNGGSVLCG